MKYIITIGLLISGIANAANKTDRVMARAKLIKAIERAADKVEVPKEVLLAICFVESSYSLVPPKLDGITESIGLCQVKLETAKDMDRIYKHKIIATRERLMDPYVNAFYAGKYLHYQLERYEGNMKKAIDAYNKGSVVSTNSSYVRKVMKHVH